MESTSKDQFRALCLATKGIPVFLSASWFDALFGADAWEVLLHQKKGNIIGFMPYVLERKKSFRVLAQQMMSPYQGPWTIYPEGQKETNRISLQRDTMESIIQQLPNTDSLRINFHPDVQDVLAFHWNDFQHTTRYTYLIHPTVKEKAWGNLRENIRREIRKAEKGLVIQESTAIDGLYALKQLVYAAKNEKYPIPESRLNSVWSWIQSTGNGQLLEVRDVKGNRQGMALFVWDDTCVYYLHGATHPEFKTGGAMSLLLWKGIESAMQQGKSFNFEGSMVASIERYFRGFGGTLTPYYQVSKVDSKVLRILKKG